MRKKPTIKWAFFEETLDEPNFSDWPDEIEFSPYILVFLEDLVVFFLIIFMRIAHYTLQVAGQNYAVYEAWYRHVSTLDCKSFICLICVQTQAN